MAGCVSCFVLPLLLFIFHRYIQPIILKFWNPWAKVEDNKKEEKLICEGNNRQKHANHNDVSTELNNECCAKG